ncbi:MAG: transcription antitermination factor NusB [Planctomycetaceae bacterium]|nr:transcription antitermination factor NusB [Planctomycetaceae bacterium]
MRPRTVGRRLALQYLFMADMNNYNGVESPHEFFTIQRRAVVDNSPEAGAGGFTFDEDDPHQDEAEEFAYTLIRDVEANQDDIDGAIEAAASNWSIARMGTIERNVLRIAAAELRRGESPKGVILDEAVELAKRFGDKESGGFVNGIADKLAATAGRRAT